MRSLFNFKYLITCICLLMGSLAIAQTPEQIDSFTKATKFDDVAEVKALLQAGVSPNVIDSKGNPMLIVAIRDKSPKVIDLLLKNPSINANLSNKSGETPLMIAAIEGELSVVKALVLEKKVDVNKTGWTPLHYACSSGRLEVAEFLVSNGAMVNALSPSETTPLMMAVSSGNDRLIKYLLDNGADLAIRNQQGFSAIDVAELFSKNEIRDGLKSRWMKLYKQPYPGGPKKIPT